MNDIHILFVDDEPDTLRAIERLLYRENYILHFAGSGQEALAVMAERPVDIVVTDMKMPGMDGLTLLRHVKERYPDTVRLALSAYLQIDVLLHCINTGEIYRYITKPIKPAELKQALRDAADFFRMREDHFNLLQELRRKNEKLEQALLQEKKVEQLLREKQMELENRNDKLRRAQAELEVSNARYLDLYDQAPVGYCTIGENGIILKANLTASTLLGIQGEALLHHPISRFVAESDQAVYDLNLNRFFDTGEPRGCDLRMVRNDGKEFWAHLAANQFQLEDGTQVRRVAITDITKRIDAEKELQNANRFLNEATDRANQLWQSRPRRPIGPKAISWRS